MNRRADFQPAKNVAKDPNFLQIMAKPEPPTAGAKPAKREPKLTRVAFKISRLMEFCSERELASQTGHGAYEWPLVILKELVDNALDAAEEAEVAPVISIAVTKDKIVIEDNADGIDAETIASVLDYSIRVSSREAYVSPTRGAQGNALKTILAMSYVIIRARGKDVEEAGVTIVEARGVAHRIEFRADHISSQPKIIHTTSPSPVTVGTSFTVHWPEPDSLTEVGWQFVQLARAYVWFNPHLTIRGTWSGREFINEEATNPAWDKWRPRNPTSAHWYDQARLQRYLAAHAARDRDLGRSRTVRAFIAEFRGLTSPTIQRRILNEVGCSHQSLSAFFGVERVNHAGVAKLLAAMKQHSKPVRPAQLGIIGEKHFKARFLKAGGALDTFKYQLRKDVRDGVPHVVEFAFGLHETGLTGGASASRLFVTGANWSAAIANPFRRFGATGEGLEATLQKVRANSNQPVICALHLASARLQFADRGKSSIILTDGAEQPRD